MAFMAVNAVRIVATALERRPFVFSEKEEQLYRVAFTSIEKKEFLKLVSLARWADYTPGDVILEKGRPVSDVIVLISGEIEAILPVRPEWHFARVNLSGMSASTVVCPVRWISWLAVMEPL
jgi:hypothetical protein